MPMHDSCSPPSCKRDRFWIIKEINQHALVNEQNAIGRLLEQCHHRAFSLSTHTGIVPVPSPCRVRETRWIGLLTVSSVLFKKLFSLQIYVLSLQYFPVAA